MLNPQNLLPIIVLRVVPACFALLLLALVPAGASPRLDRDPGFGTLGRSTKALNLTHRSVVPQRELVDVEEFFGVDNDAGQNFKAPARVHCGGHAGTRLGLSANRADYALPAPRRCRGTPPTGPPHA